MTETPQPRDLVAILQDALHQLTVHVERTREGVDAIASQVTRLRAGVDALGDLRQREIITVGVDMLVDITTDLLTAFRELDSMLRNTQEDVDTLEAALEDDEDGREA